jgi:hypothetical protein
MRVELLKVLEIGLLQYKDTVRLPKKRSKESIEMADNLDGSRGAEQECASPKKTGLMLRLCACSTND